MFPLEQLGEELGVVQAVQQDLAESPAWIQQEYEERISEAHRLFSGVDRSSRCGETGYE